jgi:hypothetical protein
LEQRRLLAGYVSASLVGTDLRIDGDLDANAIRVEETANDGEFTITGLNDGNNVPTNVNGGVSATVAGVTGNIIINMLDGDDAVTLTGIDHTGALTIDVAAGNDAVSAGSMSDPVSIGGAATIHVGDDRNTVTLSHLTVGGEFLLDAVGTAATSIPNTYVVADSAFAAGALLQLGDRTGSIRIDRTTVGGRLELDNAVREPPFSGSAVNGFVALRVTDVIVGENLKVQSWGSTMATLNNTFVRRAASIECFSSYNHIQVDYSRVVGNLTVSTLLPRIGHLGPSSSAYDTFSTNGSIVNGTMFSSTTGHLRLVYSNINDASFTLNGNASTVLIDTNIFGRLFLSVGSGNDLLTFANSVVHSTMTVFHSRFHQAGPADPVQRGSVDGFSLMKLTANQIGTLSITGGNETDIVEIFYSLIDQLFADMDLESSWDGSRAGSDLFEITGSIVSEQANLDGSGGFDLFRNRGSILNGLVLANFEAIEQ